MNTQFIDEEKKFCYRKVLKEEMLKSFLKLSNGKALGIDGFPFEFYTLLKPNIRNVYMDLFDECLHRKELSLSCALASSFSYIKK
jgi:hypothetical protein